MPGRKRRAKKASEPQDPLAAYRRIRRPMPPPERVLRDRRRDLEEDRARREMEER